MCVLSLYLIYIHIYIHIYMKRFFQMEYNLSLSNGHRRDLENISAISCPVQKLPGIERYVLISIYSRTYIYRTLPYLDIRGKDICCQVRIKAVRNICCVVWSSNPMNELTK